MNDTGQSSEEMLEIFRDAVQRCDNKEKLQVIREELNQYEGIFARFEDVIPQKIVNQFAEIKRILETKIGSL
jgi:hypothetical protein